MKVLIVEDDADMRRLLKIVMGGLDVETEEAPDGESAIHYSICTCRISAVRKSLTQFANIRRARL